MCTPPHDLISTTTDHCPMSSLMADSVHRETPPSIALSPEVGKTCADAICTGPRSIRSKQSKDPVKTSNPTPPDQSSSRLPRMLSVELMTQFLHIAEILRRFAVSPYVTVTRLLYEIMELPVASLRVEDLVDYPFVSVVDDRRLWFRWRQAGGRRCIEVKQRDMENVVLPDRIRNV